MKKTKIEKEGFLEELVTKKNKDEHCGAQYYLHEDNNKKTKGTTYFLGLNNIYFISF
jgi:hypothetical protein